MDEQVYAECRSLCAGEINLEEPVLEGYVSFDKLVSGTVQFLAFGRFRISIYDGLLCPK